MLSVILFASLLVAGSYAQANIGICTGANLLGGLINDPTVSSLTQNLCGTSSMSKCGNSNSQMTSMLLCALGSNSCGVSNAGQNQLITSLNGVMSQVMGSVPQMKQIFSNPIVCGIVQQSCCMSQGANYMDVANMLAGVISGGKTNDLIGGLIGGGNTGGNNNILGGLGDIFGKLFKF